MKIKTKTASLLLIVLILLPTILTGCTQGGEPKETVSIPSSDIPSLGSPVFMHNITDKNLKDTISAHANGGINVNVKKGDSFSFRVDGISEVKKYSIPRLAPVDKYDPTTSFQAIPTCISRSNTIKKQAYSQYPLIGGIHLRAGCPTIAYGRFLSE